MKRSLVVLALVLAAVPLTAQMSHPGRMPGLGMPTASMMSMDVAVGSDGTAYVARTSSKSDGPRYELAAIRPSGTVAWTAPLANQGMMSIAVNNTTVFVGSFGTSGTFPNITLKSVLQGFSVSSGTPFTLELEGIAMDLTAFNDGVYVLETAINPTGMMTSIGRKLVSVSNGGHVNWTLPLD